MIFFQFSQVQLWEKKTSEKWISIWMSSGRWWKESSKQYMGCSTVWRILKCWQYATSFFLHAHVTLLSSTNRTLCWHWFISFFFFSPDWWSCIGMLCDSYGFMEATQDVSREKETQRCPWTRSYRVYGSRNGRAAFGWRKSLPWVHAEWFANVGTSEKPTFLYNIRCNRAWLDQKWNGFDVLVRVDITTHELLPRTWQTDQRGSAESKVNLININCFFSL